MGANDEILKALQAIQQEIRELRTVEMAALQAELKAVQVETAQTAVAARQIAKYVGPATNVNTDRIALLLGELIRQGNLG